MIENYDNLLHSNFEEGYYLPIMISKETKNLETVTGLPVEKKIVFDRL